MRWIGCWPSTCRPSSGWSGWRRQNARPIAFACGRTEKRQRSASTKTGTTSSLPTYHTILSTIPYLPTYHTYLHTILTILNLPTIPYLPNYPSYIPSYLPYIATIPNLSTYHNYLFTYLTCLSCHTYLRLHTYLHVLTITNIMANFTLDKYSETLLMGLGGNFILLTLEQDWPELWIGLNDIFVLLCQNKFQYETYFQVNTPFGQTRSSVIKC